MRIDPRTGSVRAIHVGNQPTALAAAGGGVLVTVLPSLASHRGGTLTLIAQLSPHDQATDPALAYTIPMWQMLSVTNDGLVGYRRVGGPAGDTLVPDLAQALPAPVNGGRTYTFHLRPGIRYSTGTPVRPEDFRRAIERVFRLNHLAAGRPLHRHRRRGPVRADAQALRSRARDRHQRPGRHDHLPPDRTGPGVPLQARFPLRRRRPPRNAGPPDRAQPSCPPPAPT